MAKSVFPQVLRSFTHGGKTNLRKKKMTNQDAVLLILNANGGCMTRKDLINTLITWRSKRLAFTYLFNGGVGDGYQFVGDDIYSRGKTINFWGLSSRDYKKMEQGTRPRSWNDIKERTFYRRHFWYRSAHGTYSMTLEAFKRLGELNLS